MPLQIIHRDITTMACDAIVNPTDNCFSGSGGIRIHTMDYKNSVIIARRNADRA